MQINVRKWAPLTLFFLLGAILVFAGYTGRTGLVMASIFTPEYLSGAD